MLKTQKGMTLIEVIISIALLAIISVSFLGLFTKSFSTIFSYGRDSKSLMAANKIMDRIYDESTSGTYTTPEQIDTMIINVLSEEGYDGKYAKSDTLSELRVKNGTEIVRYFISAKENKSLIDGFEVSIAIFQTNGNRSVEATSFIVEGGS